jgi:hypothetical protein
VAEKKKKKKKRVSWDREILKQCKTAGNKFYFQPISTYKPKIWTRGERGMNDCWRGLAEIYPTLPMDTHKEKQLIVVTSTLTDCK